MISIYSTVYGDNLLYRVEGDKEGRGGNRER